MGGDTLGRCGNACPILYKVVRRTGDDDPDDSDEDGDVVAPALCRNIRCAQNTGARARRITAEKWRIRAHTATVPTTW